MILMYDEQVKRLRDGELTRYKVGRGRNWCPGTIVMYDRYAKELLNIKKKGEPK